MSNAREETIRVISFDGKATTWPSWKEKFLARAKKKRYKKILQKKVEVIKETETIPDSDPDKKVKLANRELNENAYVDLILSINASNATGRTVFNLIKMTIPMVMLAMLGQPWRRSLSLSLHLRKPNYIVFSTKQK